MTYTPIAKGSSDWDVPINAAFTDQDTRITANADSITTTNGNVASVSGRVTDLEMDGVPRITDSPFDGVVKAWNFEPNLVATSSAITTGTVYMVLVKVRQAATISNIVVSATPGGSTLTADQNFCALYDSNGTRLGVTADQSVAWATAGVYEMPITPVNIAAGDYYVAFLSNGTTAPAFTRKAAIQTALFNWMFPAGQERISQGGTGLTGLTSLPATITMTNRQAGASNLWAALT